MIGSWKAVEWIRRRVRVGVRLAGLGASLLVVACAGPQDSGDELERTWLAARVHLPEATPGYAFRMDRVLANPVIAGKARYPTVIYLHGCDGIDFISEKEGTMLAEAGYAVIMPDSFARREKPKSCNAATHTGGLHRAVLGWRQAEAMNALERARALPWVDPDELFLMGFSEGAITAATLGPAGVRARIVEGWTCHADWPEYVGINAPAAEPVLTLVGAQDPWFRRPELQGDCGPYLDAGNGSRSVVFAPPNELATHHYTSWHADVHTAIIQFLAAHRQPAAPPAS